MADYSLVGWVDEVTKLSAANFAQMDAGIKDAAEHQYTQRGLPPADAAHKNHIVKDRRTGVVYYCDGTEWTPLSAAATGRAAYVQKANISAPSGFPPPPADTVVPTSPVVFAQRIVVAEDGPINVAVVRLGRSAPLTAGVIDVTIFRDNGGQPAADYESWFGRINATRIGASMAEYGFTVRPSYPDKMAENMEVEAGEVLWVGIQCGGVTGGNVLMDTTSGGTAFTRTTFGQPWVAATNGIGGIRLLDDPVGFIVTGGTYAETFRVQDPLGTALLRVLGDGTIYGLSDRKIIGSDGTSDFVQKADGSDWINLPFTSKYTGYSDSAWSVAAYKRAPNGIVYLNGSLKSVTGQTIGFGGEIIANLPAGFRPARTGAYTCRAQWGTQDGLVQIYVRGDAAHAGEIQIVSVAPGTNGTTIVAQALLWIDLAPISFIVA